MRNYNQDSITEGLYCSIGIVTGEMKVKGFVIVVRVKRVYSQNLMCTLVMGKRSIATTRSIKEGRRWVLELKREKGSVRSIFLIEGDSEREGGERREEREVMEKERERRCGG